MAGADADGLAVADLGDVVRVDALDLEADEAAALVCVCGGPWTFSPGISASRSSA